ncbi:hypothetical protein ACTQ5N_04475 [Atopobiaceae bacterium Sow4_H2]
MYTLSVDVFDKNGNKVGSKSTKVLYCPSGKIGWQNPKGFYQVSSHNVKPKKAAYGTKFAYMTPSRIAYNATRSQCVEAFVGRAYDYLGTPYMWNYACAPRRGRGLRGPGLPVRLRLWHGLGRVQPVRPLRHRCQRMAQP